MDTPSTLQRSLRVARRGAIEAQVESSFASVLTSLTPSMSQHSFFSFSFVLPFEKKEVLAASATKRRRKLYSYATLSRDVSHRRVCFRPSRMQVEIISQSLTLTSFRELEPTSSASISFPYVSSYVSPVFSLPIYPSLLIRRFQATSSIDRVFFLLGEHQSLISLIETYRTIKFHVSPTQLATIISINLETVRRRETFSNYIRSYAIRCAGISFN